jgi:GDP-L-fucose synthase
MNKSDKIYVAGHTGLLGSALVRELQSAGYFNLLLRSHEELELTNSKAVSDFFEAAQPDYVILAAGKVGGILQNQEIPADFLTTNLKIQLNVLESAHRNNVRKLVLFGSSCMYPRECPQPMSEDILLSGVPELTSLPYAISKLAGLQLCLAYNKQFGATKFIPVIPNSVFGPNDNFDPHTGHVLSALIHRIHRAQEEGLPELTLWGTGDVRREFVYSSDIADAVIMILSSDVEKVPLPINIGSGSDYSIRELAHEIAAVVGFEGDIKWDSTKPDGAPRKLLDSARLLRLGWKPKVNFLDGLESTYKWYLENWAK